MSNDKQTGELGLQIANAMLEVFSGGKNEVTKADELYSRAKELSPAAYEMLFRKIWEDIKKYHPIVVKEVQNDTQIKKPLLWRIRQIYRGVVKR